ncbi:YnbE family lipoprotein [Shewanella gaetbuli]|uniref:YnbE family lipoprotein n=1 Tax=Shewanella gaetbuli TaxID=220752 RepID=A0A9X1ZNB1_9GAMM|nr:YnbE family lipoprotein [Shewanella gaetbuli]MCL1143055.1 YnbE family lipoprotein [Shewanella gaetbuli]
MLFSQLVIGCTPTVKIEPPDDPIVINLNVKIEHDINIKVDEPLDKDQVFKKAEQPIK